MKRSDKPRGPVIIRTKDGHEYEAKWVERINKYVSCRRGRRTADGLGSSEQTVRNKQKERAEQEAEK